ATRPRRPGQSAATGRAHQPGCSEATLGLDYAWRRSVLGGDQSLRPRPVCRVDGLMPGTWLGAAPTGGAGDDDLAAGGQLAALDPAPTGPGERRRVRGTAGGDRAGDRDRRRLRRLL